MAKDTITESELTSARQAYNNSLHNTLGFEGRRQQTALAAAFESIGITIVPDPIPEPEGDVIVVDARGIKWVRDDIGMWNRLDRDVPNAWDHVAHYGPVKIYRAEDALWAASRREPSEAATVACPHWSPGRITMRTGCTACAADAEPSNTDEREARTG